MVICNVQALLTSCLDDDLPLARAVLVDMEPKGIVSIMNTDLIVYKQFMFQQIEPKKLVALHTIQIECIINKVDLQIIGLTGIEVQVD